MRLIIIASMVGKRLTGLFVLRLHKRYEIGVALEGRQLRVVGSHAVALLAMSHHVQAKQLFQQGRTHSAKR